MELDAQEKLFWSHAGPLKREPEAPTPLTPAAQDPSKRQRVDSQNKGKGKGKNKGGKATRAARACTRVSTKRAARQRTNGGP